jgi:antitoxin (DNA-binding transcriptional repressor) of toxin-antitoxin stability system
MAHTIREARRLLSDLVREAAEGVREIEVGRRGTSEATLIGTARLRALKAELGELRARLQAGDAGFAAAGAVREVPPPYAGLTRALASGELVGAAVPRARRRIEDLRKETGIPLEAQARMGASGPREPRYRRVPPGALAASSGASSSALSSVLSAGSSAEEGT